MVIARAIMKKASKKGYKKLKRNYVPRFNPNMKYYTCTVRNMIVYLGDASGDLLNFIPAKWILAAGTNFLTIAINMFTTVKILKMKLTFQPATTVINTNGNSLPLQAAVCHYDPTGSLSQAEIMKQSYIKEINFTAGAKGSLTWYCDPNNPDENKFYNIASQATTGGGIMFYYNGGTGLANTNIMSVTVESLVVMTGRSCIW